MFTQQAVLHRPEERSVQPARVKETPLIGAWRKGTKATQNKDLTLDLVWGCEESNIFNN